jgi:hypothetical protein
MPTLSTIGAACARAWGFTSGLVKDQYFNLVSLLLPGNGTNGKKNNDFVDSSTANSGTGWPITPNGDVTQGTFSPFSQTGWGNYFNGSSNYRLTIPDSTDLDIAGDFCLELWAYFTSTTGSQQLVCIGSESAAQNGFIFYQTNSTELILYTNGGAGITTSGANITTNRWYHLALVRNGSGAGNMVIYVDGVSRGSAQITTSFTGLAANGLSIGQTYNGSFVGVLNAYLSNVRLVNGSPVYTGAFTPPTTPLTAITNTKLLTCQSNRFVDANTQVAAKTITVTGSPSVVAFSPFAPTQSYSAAAVGGSGYFDGNGDYLQVASNAAFAFGTGDFSMEFWLYPTVAATQRNISFPTANAPILNMTSSRTLEFGNYGISTIATTSNTLTLNAWNFCAASRVSGTLRLFINGVQGASVSDSTNFVQSLVNIGTDTGGIFATGYMADVRIVKGAGFTTSTVPTAPLTAITNTSLLLNFTNAGVVDATAKNVLETEGNAQISTAQSKWGGGSIAFDGTSGTYANGAPTTVPLGGGDFVVELWLYINASKAQGVFDTRASSASTAGIALYLTSGNVWQMVVNNAGFNAGGSITNSVWTHVAVVRTGTTLYLYVGGSLVNSTGLSNNLTDTTFLAGTLRDNADATTTWKMNGYIDDLRITKGNNRGYTGSSITVPTAPFPLR